MGNGTCLLLCSLERPNHHTALNWRRGSAIERRKVLGNSIQVVGNQSAGRSEDCRSTSEAVCQYMRGRCWVGGLKLDDAVWIGMTERIDTLVVVPGDK
ncbi:hypothetical protein [Syntrophus aciditrophicus]|uniref:hypothetical protein n=1 Tax=Syntrophus aciditrophicus TaxID=316277 RepID=UPI001F28E17A|nr:hypothetical protein [Syntrophus aciditrophicus]